MRKTLAPFTLAAAMLSFASCAHHRDVRPGADGVHHVIVREPTKESAERHAISQANHYCEQSNRTAAFMNESTQYTGTMDESTRDTLRKASTAATILGGTSAHARRHGEPNVLGTAGTIGSIMTNGDDYTADMKFKCQ